MRAPILSAALALMLAAPLGAEPLTITDPWVALAPPTARAHAAFMMVQNTSDAPVTIQGVQAQGYGMAHLHETREVGGIASMAALDQITLAPGAMAQFAPGGLHIMLMRPAAPGEEGAEVTLTLDLASGTRQSVTAPIRRMDHGAAHSGHSH